MKSARDAFEWQLVPVTEILPSANATSADAVKQYAQQTVWGHYASITCPIGADDDHMAVLSPKFRVRGVLGLPVVDASV